MLSVRLHKRDGKLAHTKTSDSQIYSEFLKQLSEGQCVDVFFDANVDDGTLAQLAKIHKCIRELAKEVGETFEDMKLQIKRSAGLCVRKSLDGEDYLICKSFGDCSKDELALVIESLIQKGDYVGINFR